MTPRPIHEPLRYVKAQPFIKSLQRHRGEITCQEYKELRAQAVKGDVDGATENLEATLRSRGRRSNLWP
ncbi:MAG: hypothetical protein IJG86_01890 [Clostridia bacterium]|nr:hypothetical protein [Clostridia bacterium]